MKVTTIVLNEKGTTSIVKKFFDLSYNLEHSSFKIHSLVFICDSENVQDFGHKYKNEKGFSAIEGYPIKKVAISENNEIKSLNYGSWRTEKKSVWIELYEDFIEQTEHVYNEFEFPKQYENYYFYKIDIVFNENESRFYKWNFIEGKDEFIGFMEKKNYINLVLSN